MKKLDINKIKERLTSEQYNVCFLKGTEPPFSGKYTYNKTPGNYHCAVCGSLLFSSETKYDSKTGWPAFWDVAKNKNIKTQEDLSLGVVRTEVSCANCGSHLGHVFRDGPKPTGFRYCINSLSLNFKNKDI